MDYEKAYKEVLEKAKKELNTCGSQDCDAARQIFRLFPELRESEDEKIKKWLIAQLKIKIGDNATLNDMIYKAIAWLKKQGNPQKDIPRYSIGDVLCDKSCTMINKESQPNFEITDIRNGMYICDKGSFPISQQDEYELVAKRIEPAWNEDDEIRKALIKGFIECLDLSPYPKNAQKYWHDIAIEDIFAWLEKQGKPDTIDIDKMVDDYANNKERDNEEFGKPVPCMIRAYRQGLSDAIGKVVLKSAWIKNKKK